MMSSRDNSLYGKTDMQSMQEQARKKNDEELDRICKNCCLVIGWLSVLGLFGYNIYLISTH
jgi:hypothetical protein